MALSRVGGNNTTYQSRTNTTVTTVAGIANDDILVLTLFMGVGTPASVPTPTLPSGFAQAGSTVTVSNVDNFNANFRVYYKRASGESGDYTITHSSASTQASLQVVRGVDWAAGPWAASPTTNSGTGATRTWTGLSPAVTDAMLLACAFDWADNSNNLSPPTGMTERLDVVLTYVAEELLTASGATGNRSHSCNSRSGAPWGAIMLALRPASAGQTVAVGQSSEADSALAAAKRKARSAGLPVESDAALAATRRRTRAAGIAAEADSATASGHSRRRATGMAAEADTATAAGKAKRRGAGLAAETDAAPAAGHARRRATGLAVEADAALAAARAKRRGAGLALEADTATGAGKRKAKAAGLALEADQAQAVTPKGAIGIGTAAESDAALAAGRARRRGAGLAGEADAALAASWRRSRGIGLAGEADAGLAFGRARGRAVGQAIGIDAALAATAVKFNGVVGIAAENGQALPFSALLAHLAAVATRTDGSRPVATSGARRGAAVSIGRRPASLSSGRRG